MPPPVTTGASSPRTVPASPSNGRTPWVRASPKGTAEAGAPRIRENSCDQHSPETTAWAAAPGRMLVANQVVRLNKSAALHAPDTVVLSPGLGRWDLLVLEPDTTEEAARPLMDAALDDHAPGTHGGVRGTSPTRVTPYRAGARL
ncbi:DUF5994 family protein [Streptomyces sp. NPDC005047]